MVEDDKREDQKKPRSVVKVELKDQAQQVLDAHNRVHVSAVTSASRRPYLEAVEDVSTSEGESSELQSPVTVTATKHV